MKKTRFIALLLTFILAISLLASCSADEKSNAEMNSNPGAFDSSAPSIGAPTDDSEIYYDNTSSSGNVSSPDVTKIIKTYTINAQTKEYEKALSDIDALIAENGGYIENSNISGNDLHKKGVTYRSASFVLRIPADKADAFCDALKALVNVTKLAETVQNVGQQYTDIEARLETLKSERDGLRQIIQSLNTSSQYDYWYKMTQRLSEIEQQIAVYESQLRSLDNKISYSTFNIYVDEVVEYTEAPKPEPKTFGERFGSAFKNSWKDFGKGCQNFAIWLIGAIPTLLVLGAIAAVVIKLRKKFPKKKYKAKKIAQEKTEE